MLKLKLQYFAHLMRRADSFEKTLMLGKTEGMRRLMTEDEMVGWHHRHNGHGFGWTPGVGDGQRGLVYCGSRVTKSRTRLNDRAELNLCMCCVFSHSVVSVSCNRIDCSLPGSSVHEILQAKILEWVAISFSTF